MATVAKAEKIPGKRKHCFLYTFGSHLYKRENIFVAKLYVYCHSHKETKCPGKAIIGGTDLTFILTKEHTCDGNAAKIKALYLVNQIKQKAEDSSEGLRSIFDDVSMPLS
jgi:hypothetical protein